MFGICTFHSDELVYLSTYSCLTGVYKSVTFLVV